MTIELDPIQVVTENRSVESNKALVREFIEAINSKDWRRLEFLIAADFPLSPLGAMLKIGPASTDVQEGTAAWQPTKRP